MHLIPSTPCSNLGLFSSLSAFSSHSVPNSSQYFFSILPLSSVSVSLSPSLSSFSLPSSLPTYFQQDIYFSTLPHLFQHLFLYLPHHLFIVILSPSIHLPQPLRSLSIFLPVDFYPSLPRKRKIFKSVNRRDRLKRHERDTVHTHTHTTHTLRLHLHAHFDS